MRGSLGDIAATLRASYWFIPALLTSAAVALSGALIYLDHAYPRRPGGLDALFLPTSVEGSRALLSAIVSSTMTVVAVTFSVTVVALTVASQHYGPRLLNSFMRDRTVQVVLGLLIATFAYSVFVLGSVHARGDRSLHWATAGAIVLVGCSVVALIVFVHHVSTSLQVSSVTEQITRDFDEALAKEPDRVREPRHALEEPGREETPGDDIPSSGAGYVQRIDEEGLCRLASAHDLRITIVRPPGKYVFPGVVIARVAPAGSADADVSRRINALFVLGLDRTTRSDLEFAIKQLVEIALRGLSPSVNEPFTAIACIDRLGRLLATVARRDDDPVSRLRDREGAVRVVVPRQSFETIARAALDPIRIFAGRNPAIHARLLDTVSLLAQVVTRREHLRVLAEEARLVMAAAETALADASDREYVRGKYSHAVVALEGKPTDSRDERRQHG